MISLTTGVQKRSAKPGNIRQQWTWNEKALKMMGNEQVRKANIQRMLEVPALQRYLGPAVTAKSLSLQHRPIAIDIANSAYVMHHSLV